MQLRGAPTILRMDKFHHMMCEYDSTNFRWYSSSEIRIIHMGFKLKMRFLSFDIILFFFSRCKILNGSINGDDVSMDGIGPAIQDLARALLQIEQGVDQKYLTRPLGKDTYFYVPHR